MDIMVFRFYGYIEYIGDISVNILTQIIDEPKINQNLKNKNKNKKTLKNKIRNILDILKLFCSRK